MLEFFWKIVNAQIKFSRDERISILRNAGKKVKKDLNQKILDVLKWFQKHDQIYLLLYCAFYFSFFLKGEDPEIEGTMEIYPFNIEILQAMILTQTRNFDPKPLADDVIKFKEDIIKLGNLIGLSFFDIPENFVSEESISKWELILTIRGQTLSTRNWGYPYQTFLGDRSEIVSITRIRYIRYPGWAEFKNIKPAHPNLFYFFLDSAIRCLRRPTFWKKLDKNFCLL